MIIATFKDTNSSSSTSSKKKLTQKQLTKANAHSSDSDDIVEIEPGIDQTSTIHGWAYIGSANFTPSAWGTLSGTSFKPILNV
jgi:tyrosyl-DNA phosphodiesterase-1